MNETRKRIHSRAPSKAFRALVKLEGRMALREPIGLVFGVALPVFLLIVFRSIPTINEPVPGTTLTAFEVYIPILIVVVLIFVSLTSLPIPLVRDRELGWLRRISTTPVEPSRLLAAQVVVNLVLALVAIIILLVGGFVFFGVQVPSQFGAFVLVVVLGTASMFSLGVLVAAFAPTEKSASVIAGGILYPLLFFAGLWSPAQYLPGYIQTISDLTPVGAVVHAMTNTMQGSLPTIQSLAVTAAYAVLFGAAAVRYFRWE